MKERNIKIRLVPTDATYLMCICCGNFRTEYAVEAGQGDIYAGIHKRCIPLMHVKRAGSNSNDVQDDD